MNSATSTPMSPYGKSYGTTSSDSSSQSHRSAAQQRRSADGMSFGTPHSGYYYTSTNTNSSGTDVNSDVFRMRRRTRTWAGARTASTAAQRLRRMPHKQLVWCYLTPLLVLFFWSAAVVYNTATHSGAAAASAAVVDGDAVATVSSTRGIHGSINGSSMTATSSAAPLQQSTNTLTQKANAKKHLLTKHHTKHAGKTLPVFAPLGDSQQHTLQRVIVVQPQSTTTAATATSGSVLASAQPQQAGVMAAVANQQPAVMAVETPQQQQQQDQPEPTLAQQPAQGQVAVPQQQQQQRQQQQQVRQTVYYYKPADGQDDVPSTVYDAQGRAFDLASLALNPQTEIYLQRPLEQQQQSSSLTATFGGTDTVSSTTKLQSPAELRQLSVQEWGKSASQDQMVIISTVAVMALLVGALSARRLRSKNFLSSCLENESLQDEVAYDAAQTTSSSLAYDSLGVPWKGDLEKFDV